MVDQAPEDNLVLVEDDAPAHGVDDGLGLLEDLLLHERVKLTLHDLVQLELDAVDRPGAVICLEITITFGRKKVKSDMNNTDLVLLLATVKGKTTVTNSGNIVILEINDPISVLDNGTRIRSEKVLNVGLLSS